MNASSPFGPLRELCRDRRIDADLHAVLFSVGQRLFDLLVDRLPAIDALAPVGHHWLRARHRLVVLGAVLVDVDLDAADARFGIGQHRVRFEIRDALLQFGQLLEQFLPLGIGGLLRRRRVQSDVELNILVRGDSYSLRRKAVRPADTTVTV